MTDSPIFFRNFCLCKSGIYVFFVALFSHHSIFLEDLEAVFHIRFSGISEKKKRKKPARKKKEIEPSPNFKGNLKDRCKNLKLSVCS